MYLSFYDLEKNPFQISTDPAFLWFGKQHKEAFANLKCGIQDNKGFLLLTGEVGTGKTTLINGLVDDLRDEVVIARVQDPGMNTLDFMNFISHAFTIGREFKYKDLFVAHFGRFLQTAYKKQQKVLLIIDESQRLTNGLLEEVRQLSNIERNETKLLNIFLVGQNEFNDVLTDPRNRAMRQQIAINSCLAPLDFSETRELITHRLKVAGGSEKIFSSEAIGTIFDFSVGIPRKINILCDHCLHKGFEEGIRVITSDIVKKSMGGFELSATRKGDDNILIRRSLKDKAPVEKDISYVKCEQADHSADRGSRHHVIQWSCRLVATAMILVVLMYGLNPTGKREVVTRFAGSGIQLLHIAYVTSLAFFTESHKGLTHSAPAGQGILASPIEEKSIVTLVSPMSLTSPPSFQIKEESHSGSKNELEVIREEKAFWEKNVGTPSISHVPATFVLSPVTKNEHVQLQTETEVVSKKNMAGLIPANREGNSSTMGDSDVWVTLPDHFAVIESLADGVMSWMTITGFQVAPDIPAILAPLSRRGIREMSFGTDLDKLRNDVFVLLMRPSTVSGDDDEKKIDELQAEKDNYIVPVGLEPSVAASVQIPEEDVVDYFQRLDREFSEIEAQNKMKKDLGVKGAGIESIDSGKIIDWLLSNNKQ